MLKLFAKNRYTPLFIFAVLYILFALFSYKAWPIANGEEFRYLRGKETLEHLLHGEFTELLVQPLPNHFLYNGYTALLTFLNPNFYYEWFHLINLVFSVTIFVFVYLFALELFKETKWATLSLVTLILFPTFFGQMAINPVDMPFAAFYLAALYAIYKFGKGKHLAPYQIAILGILFGISQGLRQLGLGLYILLFLYQLLLEKNLFKLIKKRFFEYLLIFVVANFFMVITWPNFAVNYFKSFAWYLSIGKDFFLWDFGLLFGGEILTNSERPQYYLPLFQLITSPVFVVVFFGFAIRFFNTLKKNHAFTLLSLAFVLNYLLYFVLNPVLYDGTRHFLYLLPIISLLSLTGLKMALEKSKNKTVKTSLIVLVILNFVFLGKRTIETFPYHYVYFNEAASILGNPYHLYESDYSSTLYKPATEWIRDIYIPENNITNLKVYACDNGYAVDYYSHKKFQVVLDTEEADLIICDYRTLKGFKGGRKTSGEIIYEVGYENTPITYIFSKKPNY
ncbi:hypothetical protein HN803_06700 [candidate division WWE3 bacterium]|nr:hypothetical protein [candidate division WWE3 bacterium]MBT7350444.1 hypothetical protein [candidate division WWE3 bacterium]